MPQNQAFNMNDSRQNLPLPSMLSTDTTVWEDHNTRITVLPNGEFHREYFYGEMWEF